jgi:hypothetical protein
MFDLNIEAIAAQLLLGPERSLGCPLEPSGSPCQI